NKGIAIFGAVLGALYGYIFKKQSYKSPLMVMIYAYCVYLIIMQFIAEQTFTNFSLHLKFIILFCIPFMFPTTKSCQQP
ncbi:MAG: oligosaccharide repeat unit polymerase, partial [Paludibacteraceae bacterium]|nr:oligosaccharide repeat unit polymerase [Paludibacteraceae bacterium]